MSLEEFTYDNQVIMKEIYGAMNTTNFLGVSVSASASDSCRDHSTKTHIPIVPQVDVVVHKAVEHETSKSCLIYCCRAEFASLPRETESRGHRSNRCRVRKQTPKFFKPQMVHIP